jgi:hypothetical protein
MTVHQQPAHEGSARSAGDPQEFRRLWGVMRRVAVTSGRLTARAAFERWQGIVRAAFAAMASDHGVEVSDATFYDRLRVAMFEVGAVEADLETLAYFYVLLVVDWTSPGSEERDRGFELITRHLVRADMTVRIRPDDTNVRVEFPGRPTRH